MTPDLSHVSAVSGRLAQAPQVAVEAAWRGVATPDAPRPDAKPNGLYDIDDWRKAPVASLDALVGAIHADKAAKVVLLAEVHGEAANRTSLAVATGLRARGERVVYAKEVAADPRMVDLVRRFDAGSMTPDAFRAAFDAAAGAYTAALLKDPALAVPGRRLALTEDLVRARAAGLRVALIDTGLADGRSRNDAMSQNILKLVKADPGARVVVALGAAHAARTTAMPSLPGDPRLPAEPPDERLKPVGLQLEKVLGDAGVLSVLVDGRVDSINNVYPGLKDLPFRTWDRIVSGPESGVDEEVERATERRGSGAR